MIALNLQLRFILIHILLAHERLSSSFVRNQLFRSLTPPFKTASFDLVAPLQPVGGAVVLIASCVPEMIMLTSFFESLAMFNMSLHHYRTVKVKRKSLICQF